MTTLTAADGSPDAVFLTAFSYHRAGEALLQQCRPHNVMDRVPAVMCLLYSVEISIKGLLALEGTDYENNHYLEKHFAQLSAAKQAKIESAFNLLAAPYAAALKATPPIIAPLSTAPLVLTDELAVMGKAIANWRYWYEGKAISLRIFPVTTALQTVILESMPTLFNRLHL